MTVTRPSTNAITGGYSSNHKGYDFSGKGDLNVYACRPGVVSQTVNLYNTSWINNGTLTTKDYGNYIKLKHDDGTSSLYAHLEKNTLIEIGTRVKAGQVIAKIGNTGNSTGRHLHFEFRNTSNINQSVNFTAGDTMPDEGLISIPKKDFESLVTKATGFDEYAKQFQSPAQAKQLIDQLKADVAGANEAKKEQEKRAEEWRKVLNSQISELSTLLDTRQEYAEIKANVEGLVARADELQKYKDAHSEDSRKWAESELSLNTEINRLNALLQDKNVLENVELAELIKELIKRFKRIINAR